MKWSRAQPNEVPLDVADLDFELATPIHDTINDALTKSDVGYPDFSGPTVNRLREIFANRQSHLYGASVDESRVEICAQSMQSLCCAVLAFTAPGDEVVTHTPCYLPIRTAVEQLGRRCVLLPVRESRSAEEFEESIRRIRPDGTRIGMIVLCQPHNPTGHLFSRETVEAVSEFAVRNDVVLFSDEVYQDLVFAPRRHVSALAANHISQTVMATSASKAFNISGLRCALVTFGSKALRERFTALPWHLRDGAGILGIRAAIAAWSECDGWLEELHSQLRRNRAVLAAGLTSTSIGWTPPDATHFAWLDFRDYFNDDADPVDTLRRTQRIRLEPGTAFGRDFGHFGRMNLGTSPGRLMNAMETFRTLPRRTGFS
ncbi:aminotransferase class I and II [Parafrankia sp. EUN1f]|nr:aminotransferase class I and II [Parafrankia sp. EUN1f]